MTQPRTETRRSPHPSNIRAPQAWDGAGVLLGLSGDFDDDVVFDTHRRTGLCVHPRSLGLVVVGVVWCRLLAGEQTEASLGVCRANFDLLRKRILLAA